MKRILAFCVAVTITAAVPAYAQSANSGTVRGSVLDPSGAALKGAAATIQNPVSHYSRTVMTDDQGKFEFENVPYNNYHFTVSVPSFQTGEEDLAVRTPVAVDVFDFERHASSLLVPHGPATLLTSFTELLNEVVSNRLQQLDSRLVGPGLKRCDHGASAALGTTSV